jgi:hypothetical protein
VSAAPKKFLSFLTEFKKHSLWHNMEKTVEASPWHREANVAVHTEMLISWYLNNINLTERTEAQQVMSLVACTFHDVGKPMAEVEKFSEERGTYRSYAGHEILSARLWVDFALTNRELVSSLGFNLQDISNLALLIEYHVPFAIKNREKRKNLKLGILSRVGKDGHQAWLDFLQSDQHGRISDDQDKKLADVEVWMQEWEKV